MNKDEKIEIELDDSLYSVLEREYPDIGVAALISELLRQWIVVFATHSEEIMRAFSDESSPEDEHAVNKLAKDTSERILRKLSTKK